MINYEIIEYKLRFYGHSPDASDNQKRAELLLIGTGQESAGPLIGRVFFWPPEVAEAKQDRIDENGRPEANMSITEIDAITNMLRYEKPIYVVWDVRARRVLLQTGQEPVGEEEGAD